MKRHIFFFDWMAIVQWVVVPVLLCLLVSSWAMAKELGDKTATALFEQTNILHTQGKLEQAVEQYSSIIHSYGLSAALLYNLANTYAAAGQVGPAVLNYERALCLAPSDPDILGNLAQVRKDAGLYRDDQPCYRRFAALLGADQWLLLAGCALLCLGLTALLAALVPGQGRSSVQWLMWAALAVVLLSLPPAFLRYQDWTIGVVLAEDAHLLISPFAEAAPASDIKVGRVVRPGKRHGDYVLVTTETSKSGWLPRSSFALIRDMP